MHQPTLLVLLGAAWLSIAPAQAQLQGQGPAGAAGNKAAYNLARDSAAASYKHARAACGVITGNPKDVCIADAKAARVRTEEEANAYYLNTLKAYTQSRMRIAAANFEHDKARCNAVTGNDKDVCISQAKATLISVQADARADSKTMEARADARADKQTAAYKVAREKCDAFAGAVKDNCVSAAKIQFGK
ncbi:hypothetical protein [Massilia sp. S19_KUP03_FR1]|uniref:hypothetical protein n=1 Tax=Massilia sp. S19_KUP03_FR1 TaxID=3025503 RepID=UPI002FCDC584